MNPEDIFGLCNRKNAIFVFLCIAAIFVHLFAQEEEAAKTEEPSCHDIVDELRENWCFNDQELFVFRSHCNDVENILSALVDAFHVRFPSR